MTIFLNPGSGAVSGSTLENANANIATFVADLTAAGIAVKEVAVNQDLEDDGRYTCILFMADGREVEVRMPGLPLDQVRYIGRGQNIWDFPRLYVDGSSWVWEFALTVCGPEES